MLKRQELTTLLLNFAMNRCHGRPGLKDALTASAQLIEEKHPDAVMSLVLTLSTQIPIATDILTEVYTLVKDRA